MSEVSTTELFNSADALYNQIIQGYNAANISETKVSLSYDADSFQLTRTTKIAEIPNITFYDRLTLLAFSIAGNVLKLSKREMINPDTDEVMADILIIAAGLRLGISEENVVFIKTNVGIDTEIYGYSKLKAANDIVPNVSKIIDFQTHSKGHFDNKLTGQAYGYTRLEAENLKSYVGPLLNLLVEKIARPAGVELKLPATKDKDRVLKFNFSLNFKKLWKNFIDWHRDK